MTEIQRYQVISKQNGFEIRSYEPFITVSVSEPGSLAGSGNKAFRQLANYIFGGNRQGQQIAMTAPVGIESNAGKWVVSFVMPAEYTMETIPKPLNSQVQLRQIPAVKKAVISFSGFYNDQKVAEKTLELEQWMKTKNLQSAGTPNFARYNPPWTLPFMRRNEVMINLRD